MVTSFVQDAVLWPADILTSRFWRVRAITENRFIVSLKRQMKKLFVLIPTDTLAKLFKQEINWMT